MTENEYLNLILKSKIFVDTCSFLHIGAYEIFCNKLLKLLIKNKIKLIVPHKVIEEINKKINEGSIDKEIIQNYYKIHTLYTNYDVFDIRGEKDDPFADNLFQQIFTRHRLKYKLALITQDKSLSVDILNLNNSHSVMGIKGIEVYNIVENNGSFDLKKFSLEELSYGITKKTLTTYTKKEQTKKFILAAKITQEKEEQLNTSYIPKQNDFCNSIKYGNLRLIKQIASGGEGITYLMDNDLVAKIYHMNRITNIRYNKLKLMVDFNLSYKGICWPKDLLFNQKKEFVGYLMDKADGKPLQHTIFIPKLLEKEFPYFRRIDLVKLSLQILNMINYLHFKGVIIGDINPLNILINKTDVFIIDTDSFQINEYPCPVGTVNFTPPELQGKNFSTFLRTFEHEYFAVATLLFMILLPGKPPYSQQGGGDPSLNIRNKDFSYPLGEKSNKKTPPGPWRFIWSNLSYELKEAFYNTFREDKRLNVSQWITILKHYQYDLENNYLSNELFPKGFKIVDPIEVRCSKCNTLENISKRNYDELLAKGKQYICKKCLSEYIKINCNECGKQFSITKNYYEMLDSNKKAVLCKECKEKLLENKNKNKQLSKESVPEKKGGFCFITSATIIALGKDDNCYELNQFRKFRDNWLIKNKNGEKLVENYYLIAPIIVENINKRKNNILIYKKIWDIYLSRCLSLIENKQFDKALKLYIKMVNILKKNFLKE